jgi:hypothetical protein
MRCLVPAIGLLLLLALALPAVADDKKVPADKKEATTTMVKAGEIVGKLQNVEGAKKSFTIELTVTYAVPDVNALASLASLQQQMAGTRDLNAMRNLQVQIIQTQARVMQLKHEAVPLDIDAGDDLKVRLKDPPAAFDEKGKPKKYTAKELKDLKGDPKLFGYAGDFDSLRPGQIVQVTLMKQKDAPKVKGGKDVDKDKLTENKPVATTIVILAEPVVP